MSNVIATQDFLSEPDDAGRKIVRAIWKDANTPDGPEDPRDASFAHAVIDEFSQLLENAKNVRNLGTD